MDLWRKGESKSVEGGPKTEDCLTTPHPPFDLCLTLQLDFSVGVIQASVVCHGAGSLQVGQDHLHAVLRAAPGLRALSRGGVTFQQSDERQHMGERGVAQRRALCREGGRCLETLEAPPSALVPGNRCGRGRVCLGSLT